ncbi:hypothetical protein [Ruegeria arenilitoris]|uniref:hypothetical protein n=1 Tax=Ruegeria arenilitoris TaxID=1173585 RepID=UPI00147BEFC4|nr:hypothetical protein [Ruegeria arenilitoris]
MAAAVTGVRANEKSVDQAACDLERLRHSLPLLRECNVTRLEVEAMLPALTKPANPTWTMARVAALLSPYFEKDVPQSIRQMEAEDWAEALSEYPLWAVQSAARWWKSADNPNRRKRPLEGDIVEQCRAIMGPIRAARIALESGSSTMCIEDASITTSRPIRRSEEKKSLEERRIRANEILRRAGYKTGIHQVGN